MTGCPKAGGRQYIPDDWASSPYVPPYEMETMEEFDFSAMPPEAVWNYDTYTTAEVRHARRAAPRRGLDAAD